MIHYYLNDPTPEKVAHLVSRGYSFTEIAKLYNCKYNRIWRLTQKHGIKPFRLANDPEEIRRLVALRMTQPEIGRRLNTCKNVIELRMREFGIKPSHANKGRRRAVKLDATQIAKLAREGRTQQEIADLVGTDQRMISKFMGRNGIFPCNGRGRKRKRP